VNVLTKNLPDVSWQLDKLEAGQLRVTAPADCRDRDTHLSAIHRHRQCARHLRVQRK
jgi:hypothetical protein